MNPIARVQRAVMHRVRRTRSRHVVRRELATTPPYPVPARADVRVHVLTSHRDIHNAVAALKSLVRFSGADLGVTVHDDGSLTPRDRRWIGAHLPGTHVLQRWIADAQMQAALVGYPALAAWRARAPLALKLLDVEWCAGGRTVIGLDSDVLFFARPETLLEAAKHYTHERYNLDTEGAPHAWPAYVLAREIGVTPVPQYNSGVTVFRRASVEHWPLYEAALKIGGGDPYLYEQTFHALAAAAGRAEALPPEYDAGGRNLKAGGAVVNQHYLFNRDYFMADDFRRNVAPALRGRHPPPVLEWFDHRLPIVAR